VSELLEVAALDSLIDELSAAQGESALAELVARNAMRLDVKFYMRLAARSDTAGEAERASLASVASSTMAILSLIAQQTKAAISSSSDTLMRLVGAAADEGTGAFVLPLRADRVAAVRAVLAEGVVDEAVLASAFAWMRKAAEDKLDGMVAVVQCVLQLWAGRELLASPEAAEDAGGAGEALVQALLAAPEGDWAALLAAAPVETQPAASRAVQARMERVVLGLPNGSNAQRVQAEYLREVEQRLSAWGAGEAEKEPQQV